MKIEEANKILEEMNVYPEELKGESKRLFEAIMKIADERDSVKADLYEANNRIDDLLDIVKQKDKLIETLLTAYEKEKEKNKKIENELEKHIKFCEQEAEGSLNNEICHISLKFNKRLLDIINEEE